MISQDQDLSKILPKEFSTLRSFGLDVYGDWADYEWVSTFKIFYTKNPTRTKRTR